MPLVRGREPTSSATLTPSKASLGVVVRSRPGEQREGAVDELHRDALERAHRLRDLEQAQVDGLLGPEQLAAGDAEDDAVADLAGGAGDGHSYGIAHEFISWVCVCAVKAVCCWNRLRARLGSGHATRLQVLVDRGEELLCASATAGRLRRAARGPWSCCRLRRSRCTPARASRRTRRPRACRPCEPRADRPRVQAKIEAIGLVEVGLPCWCWR